MKSDGGALVLFSGGQDSTVCLAYALDHIEAKGLANFDNPVFSSHPGQVTDRGIDTATGWGLRLGYLGSARSVLLTPA